MIDLNRQIQDYLAYFKKKYVQFNQEEIDQILTSDKYFKFINMVYDYFNSNVASNNNGKERLSIECYIDAEETINKFWLKLLGNKLNENIKSYLKIGI
ncbi:MAG: hypothetical protein BAJALOKI1v1_1060004 [Promethearchaeota archaeon]|nr:MAG: hypothetical protein BAJALOKI1v1_1060004 [Candidatus Lokiarchaeota archaeon]